MMKISPHARLTRRTARLCGALAAALSLAGCMELDPAFETELALTTQVDDWRDEVIYQLLVDRFADGSYANNFDVDLSALAKWHGGDWQGVEQKLPYLEQLGVTTLWISPVVKNVDTDAGFDGYHGYWAQDLTQPNPHFGDLVALRSMVAAAHERGMKVILDIVTNHMGQLFYYDINMNGEPDERVRGSGLPGQSEVVHVNEYDPDFDPRGIQAYSSLGEAGPAPVIFHHDPATNHMPPMPEILQNPAVYNRKGRTFDFDDPLQLLKGDFPGGLKDVDTTRCDVKETMVDAYARWVELTDLDGFRIDTVKHVEREFWRYFAQKVRKRLAARGKKNFFMFGEAFDGRDVLVGSYTLSDPPSVAELERENKCVKDGEPLTGDQLDSVFYFPQYFTAIRDVFQESQHTARIQDLWAQRPDNYGTVAPKGGVGLPPTSALVNFIDNHDVPRFLYQGTTESLFGALAFVFFEEGVPCVYYGTEQNFKGGNDPANREDLWDSGYDTSNATFRWISKLAALRRAYPALRRGEQRVLWASERQENEPDAGIFAFERAGGGAGDSYAAVVFNTSTRGSRSPAFEGDPMKVSLPEGTVLVDVLSPEKSTYTVQAGGGVSISLPTQSVALLVPQSQVVAGN